MSTKFLLQFVTLVSSAVFVGLPAFGADHLTVYAYTAPLGIDWTSPNSLTWSTIANSLVTDPKLIAIHSIGHLNFHLQCAPSAALPQGADIEVGQTNTDDGQMSDNILKDEYGLGTMVSDYKGAWEKPADIEADLKVRYQRGSVAFMDLSIRPESCARAAQYLQEYHARGYDQVYGGLQRKARQGLGSGCSSFAESVLEIAGVMMPEWQNYWSHTVNAPLNLIGGPLTGNRVSVLEMLFSPTTFSWNKTAKNSMVVQFWDPFLAYWWIQYAFQGKAPFKLPMVTQKRGKAKGVAIDATSMPTPTEGFWIP